MQRLIFINLSENLNHAKDVTANATSADRDATSANGRTLLTAGSQAGAPGKKDPSSTAQASPHDTPTASSTPSPEASNGTRNAHSDASPPSSSAAQHCLLDICATNLRPCIFWAADLEEDRGTLCRVVSAGPANLFPSCQASPS